MIQVLVTKWKHESCNGGEVLEGTRLTRLTRYEANKVSWQFSSEQAQLPCPSFGHFYGVAHHLLMMRSIQHITINDRRPPLWLASSFGESRYLQSARFQVTGQSQRQLQPHDRNWSHIQCYDHSFAAQSHQPTSSAQAHCLFIPLV